MADELVHEVQPYLARLAPHVAQVGSGSLAGEGPFRCVLRAAIVKAFEFARYVQKEQSEPFFLTATLRGMCEDLIVLSFLEPLGDRDEIILMVNDYDLSEALTRQRAFFAENRAWQPVLQDADQHREAAIKTMKQMAKSHAWRRNRLPTVRDMAASCGLVALYDFMYSATSKWVHFSPHVLLRLGWSAQTQKDAAGEQTIFSFSTQSFTRYYIDFNRVYGTYLLLLLIQRFIAEFSEQEQVAEIAGALNQELQGILRWPELVTHEEMNLDAPTFLQRIMLRAGRHLGS